MTTKNTELLFEAAHDGNVEEVKRLIPISNPKCDGNLALRWAVMNGHLPCVEQLIPVSDPKANDSLALGWAARYGSTECLKLLIPVSDPKANNSYALRIAVRNGHTQCVDALYGISDVKAALKHLQRNNMDDYSAWRSFEHRVEAERQHSVLSKKVGTIHTQQNKWRKI